MHTPRRRAESSLRVSAVFGKQGKRRRRLLSLPSLLVSRKADHCTARMDARGSGEGWRRATWIQLSIQTALHSMMLAGG